MIRLLWRIALLAAIAAAATWMWDRPGLVTVRWLGREIETPVSVAVIAILAILAAALFLLNLLRRLLRSPAAVRDRLSRRRGRKGYESLSKGIIAAGAGDTAAAQRHALTAARGLADEPLVKLLEAQAAQLRGDRPSVRRAFEAMLGSPETQALGLRGLFTEARQAGDLAKAKELAERALGLNPGLAWASGAMLALQTSAREWTAAAATLERQRKSGAIDSASAAKKRAALLAAEAMAIETADRDRAFALASEAHKLDPSLVPAAVAAARIESHRGGPRRAMKILRRAWALSPHPDLAEAAAYAKPGDTPEGRLARVRDLVAHAAGGEEGLIAHARAAAAARQWAEARKLLEPIVAERPQARVLALMATIEDGDGDRGRAREWLSRAVRAGPDPLWVSDGAASPLWTAVSPVTGEIGTAQWKVPFEALPRPPEDIPSPPPAPEPIAPLQLPAEPAPAIALARQPDDPGPQGDPPRAHPG